MPRLPRRLVLALVLLALPAAAPAQSPTARIGPPILFRVTDLGPATGGPVSLNNAGDVVIGPGAAGGDGYSVLRRKGAATANRIPARGFVAADISDKGAVVGWAPLGRGAGGTSLVHAALYLGNGRLRDLTPNDGLETRAVAVNAGGAVAITGMQAQFFTGGQTREVGNSDPGTDPFLPADLNAAGTLAGNQGPDPVLWRGGDFIPLERGDASEQAIVKGVSDSGYVCGYGTRVDGKDADALKWRAGALVPLDPYGESYGTVATSVNDGGNVVGYALRRGAFPNLWTGARKRGGPVQVALAVTPRMDKDVPAQRACLWIGSKNYDLNSMLPKGSGWTLRAAHEINNKDQIVGEGLLRGEARYFLLTPAR